MRRKGDSPDFEYWSPKLLTLPTGRKKIMKSKTTKIDAKIPILLEAFKKNGQMSIADIEKTLGCSRSSAYNYINRLKSKKIQLSEQSIKNTAYYSLKTADPDIHEEVYYLPITADILRKYAIIQELQENPLTKSELKKRFTVFPNHNITDGDERIPIDIGCSYFCKLLDTLIETGEITVNPNDFHCYLTGNTIPLILSVDINTLYDIYDELSNITPGSYVYKQLRTVFQKIGMYIGIITKDTPSFQNYLVYGKKQETFGVIASKLDIFRDIDFKNIIVKIKYLTKKQELISVDFATGMVIYSVEKDNIYLMGKSINRENADNCNTIINIDQICSATPTATKHLYYHSEYYRSIFDTMFSISTENAVKVVVEFDREANVERKINYLQMQRKKTASISENTENNRIIYTDTICGLSDFAGYLRQFGRCAHIIKPDELKEKMAFTIKRTLERYEEEV